MEEYRKTPAPAGLLRGFFVGDTTQTVVLFKHFARVFIGLIRFRSNFLGPLLSSWAPESHAETARPDRGAARRRSDASGVLGLCGAERFHPQRLPGEQTLRTSRQDFG